MEVISLLNGMYTKFDKCLEAHDVYKVILFERNYILYV